MSVDAKVPVSSGPSGKDPDKTADIYRAAIRIFREKGYHATSINEIADAVHLTKAGLYYYIKGKQDLLYRIMDNAMNAIEQIVVAQADEERDPVQRLRKVIAGHCSLITREGNGALAILVNELEGLPEAQRIEIETRQKAYVHFVREILDELRAAGKLRPLDSTAGAFALLGMVLWTSRWFEPNGRLSSEEVTEQMAEMALGAVLRSG